jgi:hypothetical protein
MVGAMHRLFHTLIDIAAASDRKSEFLDLMATTTARLTCSPFYSADSP